jgi:hypothetical protein
LIAGLAACAIVVGLAGLFAAIEFEDAIAGPTGFSVFALHLARTFERTAAWFGATRSAFQCETKIAFTIRHILAAFSEGALLAFGRWF